MAKAYPNRPAAHFLERNSRQFFRNALPANWIDPDVPGSDYGVDFTVQVCEGEEVTGLEFVVQLKASAEASDGDYEKIKLKVSTYNMLWDKLQVVMVVKYVDVDDEAYWQMLRDVNSPNQEAKTFTIAIPKRNRLSTMDWARFTTDLREVTDRKVAAQRAYLLGQGRR